jgi:hypothetical protein
MTSAPRSNPVPDHREWDAHRIPPAVERAPDRSPGSRGSFPFPGDPSSVVPMERSFRWGRAAAQARHAFASPDFT